MSRARPVARLGHAAAAVALACILTACAATPGDPGTRGEPEIIGRTGEGSGLQRFELRQQGRLITVQVYGIEGSRRAVAVSARSPRALDRADGQMALTAAVEAGNRIDCGGGPLRVLAETGTFQEQGRRSAFTGGEAAWIFQGLCG